MSHQWPLLGAPYKIPEVDMYKLNAKSWFRRDYASNFTGDPSTAASVQGSTNPVLDLNQAAAPDAGSRNALVVTKINAVNRIPVVSSILEFLSSPQAHEAFAPQRREASSQQAHTQQPVTPYARVITGSFTDVNGDVQGVVTFAVAATQEEDLHQFFCRAAYALCNFCNMYILSVLASHTLCKVRAYESPEEAKSKLGISLKLCTQAYNCETRNLDHHILYKIARHVHRFFFIPGNAILHEILALSLQEPAGVHTIVLRAEIPDSMLTAEHLKFVRSNVQALRTMLQASQALQLYRYLLATNTGDEHQQVESDLQMQQFVSRTPYNLGAICALTRSSSQSWSLNGAGNPTLMGYIFVYGKNAPSLNSCAFPITEKVTRARNVALHRIRGDLLYVQELPDIFPYHFAIDNSIQVDAGLVSRFAALGLHCQEPGAIGRCVSLSVVKNDPNSEPSVEHLAKFINLMSSCRRLCNKRFAAVLAVNFQVKRDSSAQSQHSGEPRWVLLESTLNEQPLALTATKQVEEELQFIFSSATGQSPLMCTLGSFLPAVRSTGAALNTLVECVMFIRERERTVQQIAAAGVVAPVNQEPEYALNVGAADFTSYIAEECTAAYTSQPCDMQDGYIASNHVRGRSMSLSKMRSEPALFPVATLTEKSRSVTDLAQEGGIHHQTQQNATRLGLHTAQPRMGHIPDHARGGTRSMQEAEPVPPTVCQQEAIGGSDGILARIASIIRRVISALTPKRETPSEDSAEGASALDGHEAQLPELDVQWLEEQIVGIDRSGVEYFVHQPPQTPARMLHGRGKNSSMHVPTCGAFSSFLASRFCKVLIAFTLAVALIAAIYVGTIRRIYATTTYLVSCDIAMAVGLPCTLVLALLCSLTAEFLLDKRQENMLQESYATPAVQAMLGAER
ncbi:hypothetical protein [Anaplasma ovis]|uniref:hypothetical protein n=1 Tax=Anaplasma ovis TaxID=142058 RepID=UPI001F28C5DC|nr:hypothetical protein [Anaplasma ovis]